MKDKLIKQDLLAKKKRESAVAGALHLTFTQTYNKVLRFVLTAAYDYYENNGRTNVATDAEYDKAFKWVQKFYTPEVDLNGYGKIIVDMGKTTSLPHVKSFISGYTLKFIADTGNLLTKEEISSLCM